jgi:hypothetical protein
VLARATSLLAIALWLTACSTDSSIAGRGFGDVRSVSFPAEYLERCTRPNGMPCTESTCIGAPLTPLCAVETFYACFVQFNGLPCAEIGGNTRHALARDAHRVDYVVVSQRTLRERDIPASANKVFAQGMVELRTDERSCSLESLCGEWLPFTYYLQPARGEWRLFYWTIEQTAFVYPVGRIGLSKATSECIGASITPVCAVETYLACTVRQDIPLCSRAGAVAPRPQPFGYFEGPLAGIDYQVTQVRAAEASDTPLTEAITPGDVAVAVRERRCETDAGCGVWEALPDYYFVRRFDEDWRVIGWVPSPFRFRSDGRYNVAGEIFCDPSCGPDIYTPPPPAGSQPLP